MGASVLSLGTSLFLLFLTPTSEFVVRHPSLTPLFPTDWKLIFEGQSVSLDPSIGNWSFDCQTHYWIKRNQAIWSYHWSQEQIQNNRAYDRNAKEHYYDKEKNLIYSPAKSKELLPVLDHPGFLARVKR
ncbi:MAG: hypothetical protein NPIRA05_08340 [Nitrospirales bacterium]|nr:MAG: hypothetical protein NPIRA05_08340 [Nitrospirales bacterium]